MKKHDIQIRIMMIETGEVGRVERSRQGGVYALENPISPPFPFLPAVGTGKGHVAEACRPGVVVVVVLSVEYGSGAPSPASSLHHCAMQMDPSESGSIAGVPEPAMPSSN